MGEVWRAVDTKLGRKVAIKILPDNFAADPDRLARFRRESQVLASLNHPNSAAIYGVEERALVLELVEGSNLAERLRQVPFHSTKLSRSQPRSPTASTNPMTRASSIGI